MIAPPSRGGRKVMASGECATQVGVNGSGRIKLTLRTREKQRMAYGHEHKDGVKKYK
jgi:hypothetical protein